MYTNQDKKNSFRCHLASASRIKGNLGILFYGIRVNISQAVPGMADLPAYRLRPERQELTLAVGVECLSVWWIKFWASEYPKKVWHQTCVSCVQFLYNQVIGLCFFFLYVYT